MSTTQDESPPTLRRGASTTMSETAAAPPDDDPVARQSTPPEPRGYSADRNWCNNFERLATRAAADPAFYEIAGSGVQARADEIEAGH
jgi:hypothetical protein